MSRRRTQNESASLRAGGVQDAQPSGSSTFLSGARNVVISDGEFNNVQGTHTNLVINLNQSPPTQGPFRNRITSNDPSVSSHRNTPNPVREARPRVPESENFASNQLPEVQQSNIIYQRHLELKGHGFPLWIPPPNQNLPIQYRRTGVCIGDVGIITPNGGFSYLFNICLPHDDPVNRRLPENFSPISEATDIDKFPVFDDDSHLASASIVKALPDSPSSGVQFESSASEGAILTMPLGATSERLGNFASFRRYAASNMIDWYKFVNGVLGREAKNGDIRLVVGCVKTSTWGIATFANQSRQSSCRLSFCPLEVPSSDSISSDSSRYVWEYSGTADVRTGPSSGERNGLKQADDPGDVVFENQCLFLCTLNATLPDKTWSEIHRDLDPSNLQLRGDLHPASAKDSVSTRYPINPSSATKNTPSTLSSHKLGKRRSPDLHSELQNDIIAFGDKPAVLDSDPLPTPISHPSGGLNGVLMTMVPAARMVITHDDDWSSVASKYDTFPDPHKLLEHILVSHHICEEDGQIMSTLTCAYLEFDANRTPH
ncbi:hypothetical protein BYT27DRAFT_7156710 [Phlegmacium glaucopus]|nr:hypothetical protein BYT27DRAFT_7156710 [Phlegmacium glaucopus]